MEMEWNIIWKSEFENGHSGHTFIRRCTSYSYPPHPHGPQDTDPDKKRRLIRKRKNSVVCVRTRTVNVNTFSTTMKDEISEGW